MLSSEVRCRILLLTGFAWGLTVIGTVGCDFDDPSDDAELLRPSKSEPILEIPSLAASSPLPFPSVTAPESDSTLDGGVGFVPEPSTTVREPTVNAPLAEPAFSRCPGGTLEIRGDYCRDVMHRCIRGGKTHTGEATGEPEPFYCNEYQKGVAQCLGRTRSINFCIDEYEYPNQKGVIPMVMVTWFQAQSRCEKARKRLCRDDEWTLACEGPERMPYPYGWVRDRNACNIDHLWMEPNDTLLGSKSAKPEDIETEVERLSKRVPSGSMPGCKSGYGVMDMGGNVDEWAVNVTLGGKPYQSVFKGGHWVSGARNRCRPVTASHDEKTYYYAEGFRCCADVRESPVPEKP